MKIPPRVLLVALAVGWSLLTINQAGWRWQSFAQFRERKSKKPTPTPNPPVATAPNSSKPRPRASAPKIEMVYVPGGSFLMGSPENESGRDSNEGPRRRVTVQGFYIGKYEVTQAQWNAVMGSNSPHSKGDSFGVAVGSAVGPTIPSIIGRRVATTSRPSFAWGSSVFAS